ncbi:MAG: helix-turn-helix domain-containing protein [Muribaculaceae bacterium]|nr:helix-turn-helix domain-containing protein [Muribaculaceae bacterium]
MKRRLIALLYLLLTLLPVMAQQRGSDAATCSTMKIKAERLPDLNIPRSGHMVLCVNGEPTVIGGHTTNFVPTPTAEYFKDGAWQVVTLAYSHDNGCAVELSTGNVLIAGGHEKELGIGQTFMAELYDPVTHTSKGFASLDTKRSMASALALDSGKAVISGNWHHTDAIEMYDGDKNFVSLKEVTDGRCAPFIWRTARDNAIIVGSRDTVGALITHPVADRLYGNPVHIPLFEQWRLILGDMYIPSQAAFIGDEAQGNYSYLFVVENDQGQLAIARTTGEEFQLLPTDVPIPMHCEWGDIKYHNYILADRLHQRAYILGLDADAYAATRSTSRVYIVIIDYAVIPARLTLGYTNELDDVDIIPLLTNDGNLMLIGGIPTNSNFQPTAATWLLHVNPQTAEAGTGFPLWGWGIAVLTTVALSAALILFARRKKNKKKEPIFQNGPDVPNNDENDSDLMLRIRQVMEEKQLFLNPDLKVADIVNELGSNRRVISDCINAHCGTFRQFVNAYRVAHAQKLLQHQPDLTITEVWISAGFSSESSFFRNFKYTTGTTPRDWKRNTP